MKLTVTASNNLFNDTKLLQESSRTNKKFGYGINYKYKKMLAHSFDRLYVVTKFILPTSEDFKFSTLNFDKIFKGK